MTARAVPEVSSAPADDPARECPACGGLGMRTFFRLPSVPARDVVLMASRAEALAVPMGAMALAFCARCGFIANTAFDPALTEYSSRYEETQGFSPTFGAFARDLAARLVARYGLRGRRIVEIGCGKGEFLALLCRLGDNRGVGIDPAWVPGRLPPDERLQFRAELWSPAHAAIPADFLCCRHTLEHIGPVGAFLREVRAAARPDAVVWFEVPDTTRVLREGAFQDVYYEHCSYFTLGSLARLYRRCGLSVEELGREYDGQYLVIGGRPAGGAAAEAAWPEADDLVATAALVDGFARACTEAIGGWRRRLDAIAGAGGRAVLWGAGSKAVAFLAALGTEGVDCAVDVNPHKAGRFLPGSGLPVMAPAALAARRPTHVIVMNPIYADEIRRHLRDLGIEAEVLPLGGERGAAG